MQNFETTAVASRMAEAIRQQRYGDAFGECQDAFLGGGADEAFDEASRCLSPDDAESLDRLARDAAGRCVVQVDYVTDGESLMEEHLTRLFVMPVVVRPGAVVGPDEIAALRDVLEATLGESHPFDLAPFLLSPYDLFRAKKTNLRNLNLALLNLIEGGDSNPPPGMGAWLPSTAAAGLPGNLEGVGAVGVLVGAIVAPLADVGGPVPETFLDDDHADTVIREFKERVGVMCPGLEFADFPMDPGPGIEVAMAHVRLAEVILLITDAIHASLSGMPGILLLDGGRTMFVAVSENGGACLADGAFDFSGTGMSALDAMALMDRDFDRVRTCGGPAEYTAAVRAGRSLH